MRALQSQVFSKDHITEILPMQKKVTLEDLSFLQEKKSASNFPVGFWFGFSLGFFKIIINLTFEIERKPEGFDWKHFHLLLTI